MTPSLKSFNKALLKHIYDMKSTKTFGKVEFGQYIRQCLEQEMRVSGISQSIRRDISNQSGSSNNRAREESGGPQRLNSSNHSSGGSSGQQNFYKTPGNL